MDFGAPHDNAVFLPVDDSQVKILVLFLLRGVKTAVSLDIRDGAGQGKVVFLEVAAIIFDAFDIMGAEFLIHHLGGHTEGSQGIRAHAVHKHAAARPHADHVAFAPAQHVLRCLRRGEQKMDVLAVCILCDKQFPVIRMIRQNVIHRSHPDNRADRRMGPDIFYLFAQAPDFPAVIQTFQILLHGLDHDPLSLSIFISRINCRKDIRKNINNKQFNDPFPCKKFFAGI